MNKVANNILELIGETPVVKLNSLVDKNSPEIYCKLESFNPLHSIKDRICLNMIEDAEQKGQIEPGDTLIEPTSGNTGIGLAYVSAVKGYNLVLTMPVTMSQERQKILKALGAKLVLTSPEKGMQGAVDKAQELAQKNGWFQPQQFKNPANPDIHRNTTAQEIIEQVPDLDAFIAGVGTGGTLTGVAEALKEELGRESVQIIAVEPEGTAVLSGDEACSHNIQGLGAGFIPEVLNTEIYDQVVPVKDEDSMKTARNLAKEEGIFAGISSGAVVRAALNVSADFKSNQKIVVILPDTGERYLSTDLFKT